MKQTEITRNYDNWKLTDWREKFEEDMPKLLCDYHIDQNVIHEVEKGKVKKFFEDLDKHYEHKYNFENLNIAEHNIVSQEETESSMIYTIQIVWANFDEVIVDSEEELKAIIDKDVDMMWEDDNTTEVNYEIDTKEEYWG